MGFRPVPNSSVMLSFKLEANMDIKAGFHLSEIFSKFVSDLSSESAKRVSTWKNSEQIW